MIRFMRSPFSNLRKGRGREGPRGKVYEREKDPNKRGRPGLRAYLRQRNLYAPRDGQHLILAVIKSTAQRNEKSKKRQIF